MIQRIQSIYLLIVILINGLLPFWISLGKKTNRTAVYALDELLYTSLFSGVIVLGIITLFKYKHRKHQFILNRLNIILNFILLGVFVYRSLILSGENAFSEKGIGMLFPIFSIVFLVLANKAIKKDEDLVKSVDRLR